MSDNYSIAEFKEDEIICAEGQVSDALFYIESGNASSYVGYDHDGGFLVELLGPKRFCGEAGFLVGEKNTVTVVANCDVRARIIHKDNFKAYLAENPSTGMELMHHMARENLALTKHIGSVSGELLGLIESLEENKPVPIDLKKKLLQYKTWTD